MHTCQECNTIIEVADLGYTAGIERFTVTNTPGVVPCARCLVIVVNLMSGEPLLASGDIDGWELPTTQRHPDTQVVKVRSPDYDSPVPYGSNALEGCECLWSEHCPLPGAPHYAPGYTPKSDDELPCLACATHHHENAECPTDALVAEQERRTRRDADAQRDYHDENHRGVPMIQCVHPRCREARRILAKP